MLIQADILQLKGLRQEVIGIHDSVIKKAKKIEVYDVLLHSLYSKRRLISGAASVKMLRKINSEIDTTEKCWMAINHSQNIFNEITNRISLSSDSNSYKEDLSSAISELKRQTRNFNSAILRYYLFTFLAEKAQIARDYKSQITILKR
ncbi:MAG: hypothetical protein IPP51_02345 [Bacteroidetes bacterium]|nr:hypothetical protein [Bacteroidota bacterium]